jgi:hypothetical protein
MIALSAGALAFACSGEPAGQLATLEQPIVYGADDRADFYELAADARASIANSAVALVPRQWLALDGERVQIQAPRWGELEGLCPGEPFADQPAPAFCSGVLVDWDLVLTGGHCVDLLAPQDLVVVMGFYYEAPGVLAVAPDDVLEPIEVVAFEHGQAGDEPRLDYGWLRVARSAPWQRRPAPIRSSPQPLPLATPLVVMASAGGTPLKLDFGATVQDPREGPLDYFVADSDTTRGSSGAGAFDEALALTGVLARGGEDFVRTDEGCRVTRVETDATNPGEQYTYATRALDGLCRRGRRVSSLCRADCGDPCQALPLPAAMEEGCALRASEGRDHRSPWLAAASLLVVLLRVARRRSR